MRILIVGDIHGELGELAGLLVRARDRHGVSAAIQLGDFGFSAGTLDRFRRSGLPFPIPVHAIDGNHEDHRWLEKERRRGACERWREEFGLLYHARASTERFGASRIGFLGGALHVDRPQDLHSPSRTTNFVQRHQRERAGALFNRERPELLVTHSCPAGIGIGMRGDPAFREGLSLYVKGAGFDPGPQDDCGEAELTRLWEGLGYRPAAWVFGHFHTPHSAVVDGVRFACPGLPFAGDGFLVWDADALRLELLEKC